MILQNNENLQTNSTTINNYKQQYQFTEQEREKKMDCKELLGGNLARWGNKQIIRDKGYGNWYGQAHLLR